MASFGQALGLISEPNGWQGRVKEGAYKSPSGTPFYFEDVGRDTPLRTKAFDFVQINGSYIQQNGYGARSYPLRCIFSGLHHDLIATSFEAALLERGIGILEHPLYGTFDVVPVGTVARRNDLVTAANQSVVEITFSTTLAEIYPSGAGFPKSEILAALDAFNLAAALEFENQTTLTSKLDQASGKSTVRKVLGAVSSSLKSVSDQVYTARREYDSNYRAINEGLDVLIGQPLLLAQQIEGLILAPSRAAIGIRNRLSGYLALAQSLFTINTGIKDGSQNESAKRANENDFAIADLSVLTSLAGSIGAVATATYKSRPEALAAALEIVSQTDAAITWREARLESLAGSVVDTGGAYQAIQEAAALTGGYLVDLSFGLLAEKSMVTERARTPIDLCAQLYGSLDDDKLQLLIDTNNFTGSEILEIPKGRTVVWYA